MHFSFYFQQKSVLRWLVGGVKIGEAIVFIIDPTIRYYRT